MDDTLSRNWWAVTIRGCLALGLGAITWSRPGLTLSILVILLGAYALDDGIFALVSAVRAARRKEVWWPVAIEGVFGIAVGVITFAMPVAAAAVVLLGIAVWAICTGALEVIGSLRLRRQIRGEWLLVLSGALRIAVGAMLLARPHAGMSVLLRWTAAYALVYGLLLLLLSFRLRRHQALRAGEAQRTGGVTPQPV